MKQIMQIGLWALAVGSVVFFAACGDDDNKEACPYSTCQYDGDNLVDCQGPVDVICADGFSCMALDGSGPVDQTEDGICANVITTAAANLVLPGIDWERLVRT